MTAATAMWKLPSQYGVRKHIGRGSFGRLYEAYDCENNRFVAIQRIEHPFDDLPACQRLLREVMVLSKLRHEAIIQMYDLVDPSTPDTSLDELYLVVEICDSEVRKLCKMDVTLTPVQVHTLLYNLLVGLKYLHSAGICHSNLKPANCLVNQDCSVKLSDFGRSGTLRRGGRAASRAPGADARGIAGAQPEEIVILHRWYWSPERLLIAEEYTEATDIWSAGCVYAELLGMLDGTAPQDRGPLLPGRNRHDQLSLIFDLLGTPEAEDVAALACGKAAQLVAGFARRKGEGLVVRFPHVHPDALDALRRMLCFSCEDRISAAGVLKHQLFSEVTDSSREVMAKAVIKLDFEEEPCLDEHTLRSYLREEVCRRRSCTASET